MELALVSGTITLVALGILFVFLRSQKTHVESSVKALQDGLDRFQNQLFAQQREFERSEDAKAASLRTEIAQHLQTNRQELQLGLSQSSQALEARFGQLSEGVQTKLELNLKEGFQHFVRVEDALKNAQTQLHDLNRVGQSINDLNNLLKLPHLRGGFGEATLERLLSDFLPQGAYELQYRIVPNSTERVDAVIKYPTYVLPIDSKFPREQILPLFETQNPDALDQARKDLVEVMRTLGKSIRSKYIHPEHGTTEMALLFVPSETLYFEVLRNPSLCEELARYKVFAVSPNTFSVMLHAVASARTYYEMAKGVEKTLLELQKATTHLSSFQRRFEEVGTALEKAQKTYDIATTHLTRYSNAVARIVESEADIALAVPAAAKSIDLPPSV